MKLTYKASGSWFQRRGAAYRKERLVILREEEVGGRQIQTKIEYCDSIRSLYLPATYTVYKYIDLFCKNVGLTGY